ncbi:hypothetical protein [Chroococcus sp. FPU101]|uniref:hypothetical protein n=1 Tax=Chroococcus sp. FPU101 TaxID=1974212 RepID=UPI001A8D4ECF|nr:hypothetical protein [Chroococcus sp. FPU101]GFE68852.1 hypothetical protein CFPU101_14620 [Chroococcus sp. FPU101]
MQAKHRNQIELSDLITDAISNAVERRNQVQETEESLTTLSDDETSAIMGGLTSGASVPVVKTPIIAGYFPIPGQEVA